MKDCCTIETSGYDGKGKVTMYCDLEDIVYDIDSDKFNIFEMSSLLGSYIMIGTGIYSDFKKYAIT